MARRKKRSPKGFRLILAIIIVLAALNALVYISNVRKEEQIERYGINQEEPFRPIELQNKTLLADHSLHFRLTNNLNHTVNCSVNVSVLSGRIMTRNWVEYVGLVEPNQTIGHITQRISFGAGRSSVRTYPLCERVR